MNRTIRDCALKREKLPRCEITSAKEIDHFLSNSLKTKGRSGFGHSWRQIAGEHKGITTNPNGTCLLDIEFDYLPRKRDSDEPQVILFEVAVLDLWGNSILET